MPSTFSHWVLLVNKELLNQAAVSSHSLLLYLHIRWHHTKKVKVKSEGGSHSVMSDSLRPHGLYSPWNSPGQNTGVGSLSLLQGTFST